MRSRVGQFHQSISLVVLGALLSLSLTSATLGQSWGQVKGDGPVIVNTDLVTLNVSVLDGSGRSVTGFDKRAFTILEDKSPQEITFFSDADVVPVLSFD